MFGGIEIDLVGQVAVRQGKRIELPSRAFAILKVFARRPGEVVSRDVLLDEAWGYEDYPNTRTVDNHLVKLRRARGDVSEPVALVFGGIEIDLVGQVAVRKGKRVELPSRAFAILKVFARRPGEVVSRDVLLDEAWGYDDYPNTRTVDNHLVKLRRALEDEPDKPRYLVTVHGAGYKLDVPREAVRRQGDRG